LLTIPIYNQQGLWVRTKFGPIPWSAMFPTSLNGRWCVYMGIVSVGSRTYLHSKRKLTCDGPEIQNTGTVFMAVGVIGLLVNKDTPEIRVCHGWMNRPNNYNHVSTYFGTFNFAGVGTYIVNNEHTSFTYRRDGHCMAKDGECTIVAT